MYDMRIKHWVERPEKTKEYKVNVTQTFHYVTIYFDEVQGYFIA